jgi:superfamily I DNA/RNA helicase
MEEKLRRLVHLAGTDPGFYVLALHSFVEHYLRDVREASAGERFGDLLWDYREKLLSEADGGYVEGLYCLKQLGKQHWFTNQVRHAFEELDRDEAVGATHLFVVFCSLSGLGQLQPVRELARNLEVWQERESVLQKTARLKQVHAELLALQSKNAELMQSVESYKAQALRAQELEVQLSRNALELEKAERRLSEKDKRLDDLRAERGRLRNEQLQLKREMRRYEELERYIRHLGRFSVYTRTRLDYERSLVRLTPEQRDAVESITLRHDFLVKGSAGTGKSLVLIESLRKALSEPELDFGNAGRERLVLLTFTRTLAKFDSYVSGLVGAPAAGELVRTVDSFFFEKLRMVEPECVVDFSLIETMARELNDTGFFSDQELATEIEHFLLANMITEQEYLEEIVLRRGLRRRLGREQRTRVWHIREQMVRRMEERLTYSKYYARQVILEALRGERPVKGAAEAAAAGEAGSGTLRDVRYLFLDETQDLAACDLACLRELTHGHMIMVGDVDQTLYGVTSPYARAGMDLSGSTRVLRTNFRNSCQIHDLASHFRKQAPAGTFEDISNTFAFREGPVPELYTADSAEELQTMLTTKLSIFLDDLGYEPENICVLAPRNREVETMAEVLAAAGHSTAVITEESFRFEQEGAIRLSTLHSSKGLDFPVVLLYLPYLHRREQWDPEVTERLLRNLLFVGLTRAMESLNVFMVPGDDPILGEIQAAFAAYHG